MFASRSLLDRLSMATRILFSLFLGACACLSAETPASLPGEPTLIAVFYSFDQPPAPDVVATMQTEIGRILAPTGVRVAWRPLSDSSPAENYPEIMVMRFHGACDAQMPIIYSELGPEGTVHELAETQRVDGKMIPFGSVECDQLRRYLAPVAVKDRAETRNSVFGKAVARVLAHEMYHMLTGSATHAKQGIARASHSRQDLTAKTFDFGKSETEWLRNWRSRSLMAGEGLSPSDINQH